MRGKKTDVQSLDLANITFFYSFFQLSKINIGFFFMVTTITLRPNVVRKQRRPLRFWHKILGSGHKVTGKELLEAQSSFYVMAGFCKIWQIINFNGTFHSHCY